VNKADIGSIVEAQVKVSEQAAAVRPARSMVPLVECENAKTTVLQVASVFI